MYFMTESKTSFMLQGWTRPSLLQCEHINHNEFPKKINYRMRRKVYTVKHILKMHFLKLQFPIWHFNFLFLALKKTWTIKKTVTIFFIIWVDQGLVIYAEQKEDNGSKKRSACSPKVVGYSTCSKIPDINKV